MFDLDFVHRMAAITKSATLQIRQGTLNDVTTSEALC